MKISRLLILNLAAILAVPASLTAFTINYTFGQTQASDATGPDWVQGSKMFNDIVSGIASGSSVTGSNIFTDTYDVTRLSWSFGPMSLTGPLTQSPGPNSPGFEDYRFDGPGTNLTFSYDHPTDGMQVWAEGVVDQFVVTVANVNATSASGAGTLTLTSATQAGQDFFNEIASLTGSSMLMTFTADNFTPVSFGLFNSAGSISAVPEPRFYASAVGLLVLGFAYFRRHFKTQRV